VSKSKTHGFSHVARAQVAQNLLGQIDSRVRSQQIEVLRIQHDPPTLCTTRQNHPGLQRIEGVSIRVHLTLLYFPGRPTRSAQDTQNRQVGRKKERRQLC
jgi:hypothetical protein